MARLGYNENTSIDTADNGVIAVQMFKQALLAHVNAVAAGSSQGVGGIPSTAHGNGHTNGNGNGTHERRASQEDANENTKLSEASNASNTNSNSAVDTRPYHIIFMDMQMPEMDGIQASKLIRQHQKMLRLPPVLQPVIIAMTANAMESDRDKCIAAGMDDYISKPISFKVRSPSVTAPLYCINSTNLLLCLVCRAYKKRLKNGLNVSCLYS
jgi:CheY-like chemotaxis protein